MAGGNDGHLLIKSQQIGKTERQAQDTDLMAHPQGLTSSSRSHLKEAPQPPQTVSPSGDQGFKHCGEHSYSIIATPLKSLYQEIKKD